MVEYVSQSAEFVGGPDYTEALLILETAGRTCYASEPNGDAEGFVRRIIGRGHESVLEHVSATVKVVVSRAVQNEIVRHRTGTAYSVQSTRYCNYGKERFGGHITCIKPPDSMDTTQKGMYYSAMAHAEDLYLDLIDDGVPPEVARDVLPLALATPMTITMNMREWRYFLKLRLDKAAHPMMRDICRKILTILKERYPVLFEDIKEEEE